MRAVVVYVENGLPDRNEAASLPYVRVECTGEIALGRREACLLVATETLDCVPAVLVDPRDVSCWARDEDDLIGGASSKPGFLRASSSATGGAGDVADGGGEMNATFFCTSLPLTVEIECRAVPLLVNAFRDGVIVVVVVVTSTGIVGEGSGGSHAGSSMGRCGTISGSGFEGERVGC